MPRNSRDLTVSMLTPSLDQAEYLESAITSVLGQDHPPKEYFVLDGGSADGSAAIIRKYADRLSGWTSGPDGGQAAALAEGFRRCTGDVLGWLNADDYLLPGALAEITRAFAEHPDADLIYGDVLHADAQGRPLLLDVLPTFRRADLLRVCCIPQPAAFWRRRACEEAGGIDGSFRFCMDYDFFLRLSARGKVIHIPRLLAVFRRHPAAKTSRLRSVWAEEERLLRARHLGRETLNGADLLRMKWLTARQMFEIARRRIKGERFPTLAPARWERLARGRFP